MIREFGFSLKVQWRSGLFLWKPEIRLRWFPQVDFHWLGFSVWFDKWNHKGGL